LCGDNAIRLDILNEIVSLEILEIAVGDLGAEALQRGVVSVADLTPILIDLLGVLLDLLRGRVGLEDDDVVSRHLVEFWWIC